MSTEAKKTSKETPVKGSAKGKASKGESSVDAPAQATASTGAKGNLSARRVVTGVVVSNKMQKTIVVAVERSVRHALYKKYVKRTQRYKAHDENNTAAMGDLVSLIESRPLSRDKRWVLQSVLRKSGQAPEANV